jgi:hypothetical protein
MGGAGQSHCVVSLLVSVNKEACFARGSLSSQRVLSVSDRNANGGRITAVLCQLLLTKLMRKLQNYIAPSKSPGCQDADGYSAARPRPKYLVWG